MPPCLSYPHSPLRPHRKVRFAASPQRIVFDDIYDTVCGRSTRHMAWRKRRDSATSVDSISPSPAQLPLLTDETGHSSQSSKSSHQDWMSSGVSPPDGTTSDDSRTPTDQITSSEVKARLRAFDLRQEVLGASQALSSRSVIASSDSGQKPYLALVGRRDGELRSFLYEPGAHANVIGRENFIRA